MTKNRKGFTLIELLVVMGVLGVLMAAIVIAINPLQQFARARDAARKNAVAQLATALASYYTTNNGSYPTAAATWITTLVTAGELKQVPPTLTGTGYTACTTNAQANYCYAGGGTNESVAYAKLESLSETGQCASATPVAYWVYSSTSGKACRLCLAAEPAATATCP